MAEKPSELVLANFSCNGDEFHVRHVQDVAPILNRNYALRNGYSDEVWKSDKDMLTAAHIPMVTYLKLKRAGIEGKALRKWLDKHPHYKLVNKTIS